MMKNRHLSKAISKQGFHEFRRLLEYKCKFRWFKLIVANTFFLPSKTCSNCGTINKNLKLSDRKYICDCGLIIDRDLNASINLSKYKLV
ncbi:MAG: zinc ribbon domain-containing protein [Peptostreptococcaceae bacterium]